MKFFTREQEALNNIRLVHNQRVEVPTIVAMMIVTDRQFRTTSALMGSTLPKRTGRGLSERSGDCQKDAYC